MACHEQVIFGRAQRRRIQQERVLVIMERAQLSMQQKKIGRLLAQNGRRAGWQVRMEVPGVLLEQRAVGRADLSEILPSKKARQDEDQRTQRFHCERAAESRRAGAVRFARA